MQSTCVNSTVQAPQRRSFVEPRTDDAAFKAHRCHSGPTLRHCVLFDTPARGYSVFTISGKLKPPSTYKAVIFEIFLDH